MLNVDKQERINKLSQEIANIIKENTDPYTSVIITDSSIRIVTDIYGIPVKENQEVIK
jgi:hypothetical protein